jgi:hypothetical protein
VSDFRIVLKSDLVINSPHAMLTSLPADLKARINKVFLDAASADKAAFDKLSDGKNLPWQPITKRRLRGHHEDDSVRGRAAEESGLGGSVPTFFAKLGNFTSYMDRLLTLDSGLRVWQNPTDWFWGISRWLRLLGETVLIAYIGTTTGAVLAFAGCFLTSRNLVRSALLRMTVRRVLESPISCLGSFSWRRSGWVHCPARWHSASTPPARSANCSPRWSKTST